VALVTLALLAGPSSATDKATPKQPQATTPRPSATFVLPNTLNEGRDPFYPSSTRVIAASRPIEKAGPGPATLELKGISGTSEQPLAIINNRTFAVGERDFITTAEGRVSVECLAIEGTKVKVSVQGETRELVLRKGI
jgi:hypothetical protein